MIVAFLAGFVTAFALCIAIVEYMLSLFKVPVATRRRDLYVRQPEFAGWARVVYEWNGQDDLQIPWKSVKLLDGRMESYDNLHYIKVEGDTLNLFSKPEGELLKHFSLEGAAVSLLPADLLDYEYFIKQFPIQVRAQESLYIWCCTSLQKEDLYLACSEASGAVLPSDQQPLPDSVYTFMTKIQGKQVDSRWLAIVLSYIYRCPSIADDFVEKMAQQVRQKIKRADPQSLVGSLILEDLQVTGLPMMTDITVISGPEDRDMKFEFNLDFESLFTATVRTDYFTINSQFLHLSLPLSVQFNIQRIVGRCQGIIKDYPSNRLWICYLEDPVFDIEVYPKVSNSLLPRLSIIKELFKFAFVQFLQEGYVYPNYDDMNWTPNSTAELSSIVKEKSFAQSLDSVNTTTSTSIDEEYLHTDLYSYFIRKPSSITHRSKAKLKRAKSKLFRKNTVTDSITTLAEPDSTPGLAQIVNLWKK